MGRVGKLLRSLGKKDKGKGDKMGACQSAEARSAKASKKKGKASHVKPAANKPAVSKVAAAAVSGSESGSSTHSSHHGEEANSEFSHVPGYSSGASTPADGRSLDGSYHGPRDRAMSGNPKTLSHSNSVLGLDNMIEARKGEGDLMNNMVHIEVPFGKPIEEVYDGVHTGPVLGSGISGLVRLVTHKATGHKYAVKCLDLGLVDSAEGLQQLREEIFIMCQLDHPNIVRLEEVYESHAEIYLVQELCTGGELFDRLDEQPDYHYTEGECAKLVKQMLCAVRYLHSKGIIHRDLKLENFLFSSTSPDSELKMIDFGLSKHFKYGEVHHEAVGTPYTVAPEVIRGSYDERCDIWAIGVITFLLLSGDPPFGGCGGPESLMTVRANILKGAFKFEPPEVWSIVSQLARDFIKSTLVIDPKNRPTAKEAQKSKWLREWAKRGKKDDDNKLNPNVVSALVNFKEYSDMRKLLCEVLSFTLLPDQIKDLRVEFEKMDTDGSGEISLAALKEVLMTNAGAGSLGSLTEDEVEDIFNAMRVRKSETRIHWHEFIAAGLSQCQVDDRNLRLAFDRLDSDHKGYITFENVMDLMGNDIEKSEDAMRSMWGDSMKACNCQHARITYENFLLLMKGQPKEQEQDELEETSAFTSSSIRFQAGQQPQPLHVLHEIRSEEGHTTDEDDHHDKIVLASGDVVNLSDGSISESKTELKPPFRKTPIEVIDEVDTPLSMDDDDDIANNGSSFSGTLTPPMSPLRGPADYITPRGGDRTGSSRSPVFRDLDKLAPLPGTVPEFPTKPEFHRRRSRSVDDQDNDDENRGPLFVTDARRATHLPEHGHKDKVIDSLIKDESKTPLVVNRTLYRAHRQMRLAVLEASKRFEEQQAQRARDILSAEEEGKDVGPYGAGLVMRHGQKKPVTSEAVRSWLLQNEKRQEALVEKANKRCGRGRRTRKKTISDMSGMLASMNSEEAAGVPLSSISTEEHSPSKMSDSESALPDGTFADGVVRDPTVPGVFRKTVDPFSKNGLYG
jgi:calcium-dependent protein kinase